MDAFQRKTLRESSTMQELHNNHQVAFFICHFCTKGGSQFSFISCGTYRVCTSVVFDSYPRGMHAFPPLLVFRKFFYQTCLEIDPFNYPQIARVASCNDDGRVYKRILSRLGDEWKKIFSNSTCFSCMARKPENNMTCRHSLGVCFFTK
ncbi:Calcium-independent phospholipase A2-gamma protein [Rutstroemia sp. NJR-2017a WRK4]|nr:Calcium-independent phospholipase A2-gamma protein [Rutstroemia sp. NJR-2017a WRK4]